MDEDNKIRRNLVVASSIVVATAWLGMPIPDLLERLFSIKGAPLINLPEWKVWLTVIVVLGYLAWRYRWSDEFTNGWDDHQKSAEERFIELYETEYYKEVGKWAVSGAYPSDLHPDLKRNMESVLGFDRGDRLTRPTNVKLTRFTKPSSDSGSASANIYAEWETPAAAETVGGIGVLGSPRLEIPIDLQRHRVLLSRARWYAHYNSKASMALFWPIGLAAIAAAISVYRLADSLV